MPNNLVLVLVVTILGLSLGLFLISYHKNRVLRRVRQELPARGGKEIEEKVPTTFFPLERYLKLLPLVESIEEVAALEQAAFGYFKNKFCLEEPPASLKRLLAEERRLEMGDEAWARLVAEEAKKEMEAAQALEAARIALEEKKRRAAEEKRLATEQREIEAKKVLEALKDKQVRLPYGRSGHEVTSWPSAITHYIGSTQCGRDFSLNQSRFDYGEVVEGLPPCKACEKAKETARRQAEVQDLIRGKRVSE